MNTDFDVRYVAGLAKVRLSGEECAKFQSQLSLVLDYVEKLKAVDVSQVEPTAHANPVFTTAREDAPRDGLTQKEALANAPRQGGGLFVVPKVIE